MERFCGPNDSDLSTFGRFYWLTAYYLYCDVWHRYILTSIVFSVVKQNTLFSFDSFKGMLAKDLLSFFVRLFHVSTFKSWAFDNTWPTCLEFSFQAPLQNSYTVNKEYCSILSPMSVAFSLAENLLCLLWWSDLLFFLYLNIVVFVKSDENANFCRHFVNYFVTC